MKSPIFYEHAFDRDIAILHKKLENPSLIKGMFILVKGTGHGSSMDIQNYILELFKTHRNTDTQVYPVPNNPD